MKISALQIRNYKSFHDSGILKLSSGINVVVGQNNSGKTALLEAATLKFTSHPHRSAANFDGKDSGSGVSSVNISIVITGREFGEFIDQGQQFVLSIPPELKNNYKHVEQSLFQQQLDAYLNTIISQPELEFTAEVTAGPNKSATLKKVKGPDFLYEGSDFFEVNAINLHNRFFRSTFAPAEAKSIGWKILADQILENIYNFKAQRINLSRSVHGNNDILESDGSNLAEVLNRLQGRNPDAMHELNIIVAKIFPSIRKVSVVSVEVPIDVELTNDLGSKYDLEILTWPANGRFDRPDLAISLTECGTGVGQVLAILYVVLTSRTPKTIVIDEPNSFLHPGATRKLIELLRKDFSRHQYLISTHSSEVIQSSHPASLTVVKWQPDGSVCEQLNWQNISSAEFALHELGIKMSDVFGADSIVWVEGPTEEASLKFLISELFDKPATGISILPVVNTGDFESKKLSLARVIDVYDRFSKGNALVPPSIAFIFDTEDRNFQEIEDIKRRGKGKIHFLPRRMFENYILDSEAINAVLRDQGNAFGYKGTAEEVARWIENNGKNIEFIDRSHDKYKIRSQEWLNFVHGARLLASLFEYFLGEKLKFSKTCHSVLISNWLVLNKPDSLTELKNFLQRIIPLEN